ncbi:ABC transporter ATP-binding protein [Antarctobacter heliothermus]|uniref:Peptide/nickel transport system ATP-binding protein n=1 Tax=Antarctobacter heliothermus TaxID=74033 RepID=A0A239FYQ1_9RHOB|nr:oligopeptide/dipeptide ABC transporter ATP-binding protein [Antarctobacter heliothermus]SNS60904.1 peptide/nickel transport system ATP-binding protein [Antarctobacter heliothermus]
MTDSILEVRDLTMSFGGNKGGWLSKPAKGFVAVDAVSFDVRRGETFGIVGESGSGKTTLGRCILRVLDPSDGSIRFRPQSGQEVDLADAPIEQLRQVWRKLRMIFQDPQASLNPRLRVIDIVGQALQKSEGLRGKALAERVGTLLENVGLRHEFMHRYPNAFSGGQRQRLGIARALSTHPELVVADEAVSALDVSIQAQTLNLLQDLQQEFSLTFVFIAHDLAVVEHICDRVAVMYRGQFVEVADTATLFRAPQHPYTRALLQAVPVADPRQRRRKAGAGAEPVDVTASTTGCRFAPRCPHATDLCRATRPPVRNIGGADVLCHFAGEI